MGIFNFLFGSKKQKESQQISVTVAQPKEFDYYRPKYFKILNSRPNMSEMYGRGFDFPKYNDNFITPEGYPLRELLLLVWWGKTKSGRKSTISIPKYFFHDYNLNAEKITRKFKDKSLLYDDEGKTLLTEKGRVIADKYSSLWEIHSAKEYPTNLDIDFPTWDKNKFDLMMCQIQIKYHSEYAKFCKELVNYFNSLNAPTSALEIHNEINYYINEMNSNLARVNDLKEKLVILQDRVDDNI